VLTWPRMDGLGFLWNHRGVAGYAAIVFFAGMTAAWPVMKFRVRFLSTFPVAFLTWIRVVLGNDPSLPKMALFIFGFNSVAMFVYMSAGIIRGLPWIVAFWTGLNIGVVMARASDLDAFAYPGHPADHKVEQSAAGMAIAVLCFLLTLSLELPCFWFSIAMGISLSTDTSVGSLTDIWLVRAKVYATFIVPALFISAVAESRAISGIR